MIQETLQVAMTKHQQGQLDEAGALYHRVLQWEPNNLSALSLLGMIAEQKGELDTAVELAGKAINLRPTSLTLYVNLANPLLTAGRVDEAIDTLQKALKLDKRSPEVLALTGDAYQRRGDYATAIDFYQKALRFTKSDAILFNNLGNALLALGKSEEAIAHYERALGLQPDYADAQFNLGRAFYNLAQYDHAIASLEKLIAACPGYYKAYGLLATSYSTVHRLDEALKNYQLALKLTPIPAENLPNLYNLGNLYKAIQQMDSAVDCYNVALKINPDYLPALQNLAQVLIDQGKPEEAIAVYDKIQALCSGLEALEITKAFCMPVIYESSAHIDETRARFETRLDQLLEKDIAISNLQDVLGTTSFYLNYQGRNDRPLQEKVSRLIRRYLPGDLSGELTPNAKPRIGFISRYISEKHTIGKFITGVICNLSRERFDVTVFSVGTDYLYEPAENADPADTYLTLPLRNLDEARRMILAQNLDTLFYVDIGMDPVTYNLAHTRLAKVQCVTWGHPVTSGIPTVDYYISSRLIEPADAASHYNEKLVLLDSLPTYYKRPNVENSPLTREALGLAVDRHLYLCPQSLFKFHPDFDALVADILRRDPLGTLVLVKHPSSHCNGLLMARLQRTMPEVTDRIHWVERLNRDEFLSLIALADVMLDIPQFGGGNTTYEALALGTPIVTLPGEFMRGRVTAGCYRKMGLEECIAASPAEYVEKALSLGTDPAARSAMRDKILARCDALYEDTDALQELEAFFLKALEEAGQ